MGKPKDILLQWRDHHQRLSRNDIRYGKNAFFEAKIHYLSKSPMFKDVLNSHKNLIIWGAGKTGNLIYTKLKNLDIPVQAFVDVSKRLIGNPKGGIPIYDAMQFNFTDCIVLVAVGTRGIRAMIEEHLASLKTPSPIKIALC